MINQVLKYIDENIKPNQEIRIQKQEYGIVIHLDTILTAYEEKSGEEKGRKATRTFNKHILLNREEIEHSKFNLLIYTLEKLFEI